MKKIFTILFAGMGICQMQAQTISNANFPMVGEIWVEFKDTSGSAINITPAGTSQVWNYATSFTVSDTTGLNFRPVSDAPAYMNSGTNFPGASMTVIDDAMDSSATFLKSNSTGFYYDGVYDEGTINLPAVGLYMSAIDYSPDRLIIPAPFSYNDTRTNNAKFHIEFTYNVPPTPPFLVEIDNYTIQDFIADGTGTLTTPLGTFNNVLRIKEYTYQLDSTDYSLALIPDTVNAHDTVITYSFLHANSHCLLMTVEINALTLQTIKASYYDPIVLVGDEDNTSIPVTMYPNPASEEFYLNHVRNQSTIHIYDATGKLVKHQYLGGLESNIKLNTSEMPSGFYFFSISNAKNGNYFNGKFEVVK
jgi:hypothetical protein